MTEKIRNKAVAQDFGNQDLLNVKLKKLSSDPTRVEGVVQYQENVLKVGGASDWITLANDADLQDHIGNVANPHSVSLEQARNENNQLSGNIDANSNTIVNLADPTDSGDAANRGWVLSQIDVAKNGFDYKQEVRAAITANVDISTALVNGASLGGVTLATGDRVALVGQSTASQNGIYVVVASGAASRSTDANSSSEVTTGMYFVVIAGTKAGSAYVLTTEGSITLGTTDLTFAQYFAGASYSAGDGLLLTGSVFSAKVSDFASNGLADDGSNNLVVVSDATGGANLAKSINVSANGLAVKIDDSTIGENGSARLFVKNAGITETQLAASVAGAGLSGGAGTALSVSVDDATIEINSDTLRIKSSVFGSGLSYSSNVASVNWASQKYNMSFNATTDWGTINGDGQYVITVLAATHSLGTEPVVVGVVGIDGSSNKYGTELYHEVNTSGDVLIYVTGASARFAGKLYLVKA